MFWEELNVNSFKEAVETTKGVCIFTMGCLEKHGNHLPLGTDIITAREIAKRATAIEDAMIFPSYPLGIVAEVKHKAGTIAISSQLQFTVLEAIFDEISRNGFKKIIIVSGHGGNDYFLNYFAQVMVEKKKDYTVYNCGQIKLNRAQDKAMIEKYGPVEKGAHAGFTETSTIMALRPELMHMDLMDPEQSRSQGRADWYNEHGVYTGINWYASYPYQFAGDPTGSSPEYGEDLTNYKAQNLAEIIKKVKEDDTLPDLFAEFYAQHDDPQI